MPRSLLTVALLALCGYAAAVALADDPGEAPAPETPAAEQPAGESTDAPAAEGEGDKSAEDVLNDLLKRRDENPLIEPTRPNPEQTRPRVTDRPAPAAIRGVSPAAGDVQLKREGEFVITRRGRLVPATGGASPWMIAFEADANGLSDPPMFVLPCRLLEEMEQMVGQHGDSAVFVVSGQVFVYHGANYLMPTLMKMTHDRGNLQP